MESIVTITVRQARTKKEWGWKLLDIGVGGWGIKICWKDTRRDFNA